MPRLARPAVPDLDPEKLFAALAGEAGLVLAVSGGVDSTALMALVAAWAGRPPALVVCVDHGLRAEAAAEARQVAVNAERLGLPWRILQASRRGPGNLQEWAREVRYENLARAARDAGFPVVVTAHHRDDQAETFLLRLARGSGVYGLAGMRAQHELHGIRIARPLLGISREALERVAEASGLPTAADPSNDDPSFARVRMRALMRTLAGHGITAERLAETSANLARAAEALDRDVDALLLASHAGVDRFGVLRADAAALAAAPEEISLRALARLLQAVGGAPYTPSLTSLKALEGALSDALAGSEHAAGLRRTLHGVVIESRGGRLTVRREWGRRGPPCMPASAGATLVWDRRFRVETPGWARDAVIAPLGLAAAAGVSEPWRVGRWRTMPGLFQAGQLVALPEELACGEVGRSLPGFAATCIVGARLGLPIPLAD